MFFVLHLSLLSYYVYETYIAGVYGKLHDGAGAPLVLLPGLLFFSLYEVRQWYVMRAAYWKGPWNHTDLFYITFQTINVSVHFFYDKHGEILPVLMMVIVLFMTTIKLLFYLQNIESISTLVILMTQVIYDLRLYMIFFFILVYLFALIIGTLGVGN